MNLTSVNIFLQNNASFISYVAFLLTIANFVYLYFKDIQNHKRWEALNLARIVIKDLRMIPWRKISRVEFEQTNWGYNDCFGFIETNEYGIMDSNVLLVSASVVAFDSNGKLLSGTNAITINELTKQLIQRGFDPNKYIFIKLFRITFIIENTGATIATKIKVTTEFTDLNDKIPGLMDESSQILQPGERSWTTCNLRLDLDELFPEKFQFQINIEYYDVNNEKHQINNHYIFDRSVGTFRHAN